MKVPLLVLPNIVFFPNTSLPLYIADKSYEKLIQSAIQHNQLVGVSLEVDENIYEDFHGSEIFGVGHPIIVERMNNGILKILLKGIHRVKCLSIEQYAPFIEANVEVIEDDISNKRLLKNKKFDKLKEILDEWLNKTITDELERNQFCHTIDTKEKVIDYVSTLMIQDKGIRQILLENTNITERTDILSLMLDIKYPFYEKIEVCEALKDFENLENIARWAN